LNFSLIDFFLAGGTGSGEDTRWWVSVADMFSLGWEERGDLELEV